MKPHPRYQHGYGMSSVVEHIRLHQTGFIVEAAAWQRSGLESPDTKESMEEKEKVSTDMESRARFHSSQKVVRI